MSVNDDLWPPKAAIPPEPLTEDIRQQRDRLRKEVERLYFQMDPYGSSLHEIEHLSPVLHYGDLTSGREWWRK